MYITSFHPLSPLTFDAAHQQRLRGNSIHPLQAINNHGAVRKRTVSERSLSESVAHAERLHSILALGQCANSTSHATAPTSGLRWPTPHPSPQPEPILADASVEPFPTWTVPTPPRSDSGIPTVSIDVNDEPARAGIRASNDFQFDQPTTSAEMSSLGFLLPSQYGSTVYESEPSSYPMDQNYPPMRMSQPGATTGAPAYSQTISSSPALYQSKTAPDPHVRRQSELASGSIDSSYSSNYRRISSSYDSASASSYSMASGPTIPSISGLTQSPLPSPHIGSNSGPGTMSQYHTSLVRSHGMNDESVYSHAYPTSTGPPPMYSTSQSLGYPPPFVGSSVNEVLAKPLGSEQSIRVLNQRPKPQCWEHGCNGRQFSTFSNLLRHQREKSGTAAKSYCPKCGAEFTRTTARNGHLAHDKCQKQRRHSDK